MPQNHHDRVALFLALLQTPTNQRRPNSLTLKLGFDCHRSERQRSNRPMCSFNHQVAEQDVPHNVAVDNCD